MMRAFLLALLAIAAVTVAAGCGGSSTTTTRPPKPQTFASQPYGFRVTLTPNWEEQDAQAAWDGKGLPDLSDPAWALFTDTVTGNNLAVVSAPTGMGLAGFKAAMQAALLRSPGASHSCRASSSAAQTSVGGEPALEWTATCASGDHVNSLAVLRRTHGYLILVNTHPGSNAAESRSFFESMRRSFRFTR
jgi:hypothetical protein